MAVVLVQGASRGIGLQFCRHFLQNVPNSAVIATCRKPEEAFDLQQLQKQYGDRLIKKKVDMWQEDTIQTAAEETTQQHGKLDLLINSSGILHPSGRGETSLKDVSMEGLMTTFQTNTFGPLLMAKYFGKLLQAGSGSVGRQAGDKKGHCGVLVNMSAKVGSITDNGLGGWYSYRMSKAALNMATKNLSIEFGRGRKKVICVALHPGTVNTDLSRPYHKGVPEGKLFTTEYSVSCLMQIINNVTAADTGKYFSWDGTELPF